MHLYQGQGDTVTTNGDDSNDNNIIDMDDVGFVLLAGGTGSRMKATMPKQFLDLRGVPVLHHSLHLLLHALPAYYEQENERKNDNNKNNDIVMPRPPPFVVLVLDPKYQPEYQSMVDKYNGRLVFANPGVERQGSVQNGLAKLMEISTTPTTTATTTTTTSPSSCNYVAIHDSARPLVSISEIISVVRDAKLYGAAVLGVPCKATIKESDDDGKTVLRTIPRSRLWEVHTPQVIRIDTLVRGFAKVEAERIQVTDDVSIVEALGETVKLTLGEYTNLKITTPEDMNVAESILIQRNAERIDMLA